MDWSYRRFIRHGTAHLLLPERSSKESTSARSGASGSDQGRVRIHEYPQRGPRDKRGRSLRDFDLQGRLFRYPLSYMIYSPVFDAMPITARDRVYQRLYDVLSGKDESPTFRHLSAEDRLAILEILRDTKPQSLAPRDGARTDG